MRPFPATETAFCKLLICLENGLVVGVVARPFTSATVAAFRASSCGFQPGLAAPVEASKCDHGTAALLVVLDQQPDADALHAHHALPVFSFIEWNAAIFDEGNHSLLRLNHGAEHTAVNTLRGGIGVLAFNAQLATVTARD